VLQSLPYLKLVRGVGWEDSHWAQLFAWLGIKTTGPNAVSKDNVTLAHFLDKADAILKNAENIKKLDAQVRSKHHTHGPGPTAALLVRLKKTRCMIILLRSLRCEVGVELIHWIHWN
jgi:hypothetical protein